MFHINKNLKINIAPPIFIKTTQSFIMKGNVFVNTYIKNANKHIINIIAIIDIGKEMLFVI